MKLKAMAGAALIALTAFAATAADTLKEPFSFPLRQWGLILAAALLGGFVSWHGKLKRGEITNTSVTAFVGEMTTAAFAGMGAWLVCEWLNASPLLIPCIVGLAGHMGGRMIVVAEGVLRRYVESKAPSRD